MEERPEGGRESGVKVQRRVSDGGFSHVTQGRREGVKVRVSVVA